MQIRFNFHNLDEHRFLVRVDNDEYKVDSITPCISIDSPQRDTLEVSITQCPHDRSTWLSWVIWLFTLPLQGLFASLMVYGEDEWYKQINPYLMTARILIEPRQASEVNISVKVCNHDQWLRTAIDVEQAKDIAVSYSLHSQAIYAAYIRYIKQVISVGFNAIVLFFVLLYNLFHSGNRAGVYICAVLIASIVLLGLILVVTQYYKARKLKDALLKQNL